MSGAMGPARQAARIAAGLLWPRRCPFCNGVLGSQVVCGACRERLQAVEHRPPRLPETEHSFSGISGAASLYYYQGIARSAVLQMKWGSRPWYGRELAAMMAAQQFGYTFFVKYGILHSVQKEWGIPPCSSVVPVPPHHPAGGFSGPELLAQELARWLEVPVLHALEKTRETPRQAQLSGQQRRTNLQGAFRARPGLGPRLEGARVLLVDDIITTGATVSACGQALLQGGAADVFAVSVAVSEERSPKENQALAQTGQAPRRAGSR